MSDGGDNESAISGLRYELKSWESSFTRAHGHKPGREDIKSDAAISAKYKEYDQLRTQSLKPQSTPRKAAKSKPQTDGSVPLKERSANAIIATPRKPTKGTKNLQQPEVPSIAEEQPTPAAVRCALGPTPQKDGEILGIFDILSSTTPSKADATTANVHVPTVSATPCKQTAPTSSMQKPSRTPQSSGKRFFLGAFEGTPLKRKREEDHYTPNTAKRRFATPSFLRRSFPLSRIDEGDEEVSAPPFKKRGLVRSLSSIIHGLKKQEEQRMDDEWEIMNEIEAEERGESRQPSVPKVLVEDSQAVEMRLGPDQGVESSEDESAADPGALDANGNPRKVWKKKGLKRQTRRVTMKPVLHKPKKAADGAAADYEESEAEAVAETQEPDVNLGETEEASNGNGSGGEAYGADYKHDSQQSHRERAESKPKKQKKANRKDQSRSKAADGAETSKKPKKTSAQAHANFRKLKIKNKNSKASGRGGRFGRR